MKKLTLTFAAILIGSIIFCQAVDTGLGLITEETKTGRRLIGHDPLNYGRIGENAIDLSYSNVASTLYGARGDNSFATGYKTIAERFYCTAMGIETVASGDRTTAMGENTTASGYAATAMGSNNIASGNYSTAMGANNIASGRYSISLGRYTASEGYGTTSIGLYNTLDNNAIPTTLDASNRAFVIGNGTSTSSRSDAMTVLFDGTTTIAGDVIANSFSGDGSGLSNVPSDGLQKVFELGNVGYRLYPFNILYKGFIGDGAIDMSYADESNIGFNNGAIGSHSFATGKGTIAIGSLSTAMGQNTRATGRIATAMGDSTFARGFYSTSMGRYTESGGYGTTALGLWNTLDTNAIRTTFSPSNRAFVIGNGTDTISRSDAMTVLFDGTTTIAGDLTVNSDKRLKSNIFSLGSTISQLGLIDAKSYTLKNNESKIKIGLLAQDVQKVFPQLVYESKDDQKILSINYQGLIPVLINAVNEHQETIEKQQIQIDKLSEMVLALTKEK